MITFAEVNDLCRTYFVPKLMIFLQFVPKFTRAEVCLPDHQQQSSTLVSNEQTKELKRPKKQFKPLLTLLPLVCLPITIFVIFGSDIIRSEIVVPGIQQKYFKGILKAFWNAIICSIQTVLKSIRNYTVTTSLS